MTEKITGEKLEQIFDLCYEYDLFDFIFDQESNILTTQEWEIYFEYSARLKDFIKEVGKKNPDKKQFPMSGEEKEILEKFDRISSEREKSYKKTLVKKKTDHFLKTLQTYLHLKKQLMKSKRQCKRSLEN